METSAEDALLERVTAFVARERGESAGKLTPQTRLQHDLGVDGDDGVELLEEFARRFGVDLSDLEWRRHFGPEGIGCLLLPLSLWYAPPDVHPWPEPITLQDLAEAARAKRWMMFYAVAARGGR